MRLPFLGRAAARILGAVLVVLTGCASSKPSRFYTLAPMKAPDSYARSVPAEPGTVVAVGPVELPGYLDRPQIVTGAGGTELRMAETERWAGPLEEDVSRVLIENLSVLLAGRNVRLVPWGSAAYPSLPVRFRIGVELVRFEGPVGGPVVLKARYVVHGGDGKTALAMGESNVREAVEGSGYEALVEGMSRALATFAREIAAALPAGN